MAERTVVRVVWNFCEGIPVSILPAKKRWLRSPDPYRLYGVVGELFHQEGNLWLDIHRKLEDGYRKRFWDQGFWVELFKKELDERVFTAVWHDDTRHYRDWLCFKFGVVNGQNFSDTALDRSVCVFKRLGVKVKTSPLMGRVTQYCDLPSTGLWNDLALYRFGDALNRQGLSY